MHDIMLVQLHQLASTSPPGSWHAEPRWIKVLGKTWSFATDSHCLVAVQEDYRHELDRDQRLKRASRTVEKAVRDWILTTPREFPLDLAGLREWAGSPEWPSGVCAICNGSGKWTCSACNGNGWVDCACPDCGTEHRRRCRCDDGIARCETCLGSGKAPGKHNHRMGLVGGCGLLIDRVLLARVLYSAPCDSEEVKGHIDVDGKCFHIMVGDTWHGIVKGMDSLLSAAELAEQCCDETTLISQFEVEH